MKLKDFTYTKPNGAVSDRTLVVISEPNKNYFGIDVSELTAEDFHSFMTKYNAVKNEFHESVSGLLKDYDLKHNYRNFDPDKMTNVSEYAFT